MCDTWVALADATANQRVLFGKNSDRPIFDCQPLVLNPRRPWPDGSVLRLAYHELAQAPVTYATLGSRPYWCWGYEEGINEFGVVIGNEAVYTKPQRRQISSFDQNGQLELGILGMELLRLALERSRTAEQAVALIGHLTETYGQSGSAVPGKNHRDGGYDNSFLIADGGEAWILETAGRRWAAERFASGVTSISNQLAIRTHWTAGSPDLATHAVDQGWWPAAQSQCLDFARAYIDETVPRHLSHLRMMRSRQLLAERQGAIDVAWMKRIAHDHYEDTFLDGPYFDAADPDFLSLCMHVSPGRFTWGNTASSCVAVLPQSRGEIPVFWWTPGPPCNGCYVPFFVHADGLPPIVSQAGTSGGCYVQPLQTTEDAFSPDSYWWLFRRLLDETKGAEEGSAPGQYPARNPAVRARFDSLERSFAEQLPDVLAQIGPAEALTTQDRQRLSEFSTACVSAVLAALRELLREFGV
jgi:secernin